MSKFTVVGLGSIVIDEQMLVDRVPDEDEKECATGIRRQVGGPVPTALALLSRFGQSCCFIGPWGSDSHGRTIAADLDREGIVASASCPQEESVSGVAHVWACASTGTRTIVAHPCEWNGFRLADADISALRSCRLLHLDCTGGAVATRAAREVRQAGGLITVDAGSPKEATHSLVELADVFSFPERFSRQFFGTDDYRDAGRKLLNMGAAAVVCTRGDQGAVLFAGDREVDISAITADVVDSTGAGDVFCGGIIAGVLRGESLERCVRIGAAAASLKCRHIGNRDALPSWEQVQELL